MAGLVIVKNADTCAYGRFYYSIHQMIISLRGTRQYDENTYEPFATVKVFIANSKLHCKYHVCRDVFIVGPMSEIIFHRGYIVYMDDRRNVGGVISYGKNIIISSRLIKVDS